MNEPPRAANEGRVRNVLQFSIYTGKRQCRRSQKQAVEYGDVLHPLRSFGFHRGSIGPPRKRDCWRVRKDARLACGGMLRGVVGGIVRLGVQASSGPNRGHPKIHSGVPGRKPDRATCLQQARPIFLLILPLHCLL